MKIRWLTRATRLLRAIHSRIAEENPAAAKGVVRSIEQATHRLREFPLSGRVGRIAGTSELVVRGLPYIIVYRINDGEIQILRVFHTAIEWPAILE